MQHLVRGNAHARLSVKELLTYIFFINPLTEDTKYNIKLYYTSLIFKESKCLFLQYILPRCFGSYEEVHVGSPTHLSTTEGRQAKASVDIAAVLMCSY